MSENPQPNNAAEAVALPPNPEEVSTDRMKGLVRWIAIVVGILGILLNINKLFNLQFFVGALMIDTSYYYLLAGLFLATVFLIYPAYSGDRDRVPWFDWLLAALTLLLTGYLSWNGERIIQEGWENLAPPDANIMKQSLSFLGEGVQAWVPNDVTVIAALFCFLGLEGIRRVGGWLLFFICAFFFAYPLFADQMPGFLWGPSDDFGTMVQKHALGTESMIGVPMRVVAGLLIGFLIFGSALVVTGGGEFFMTFATALMGRSRGGPAKVAILSSGFFGSLSGSVISNVVTTGQLTIPTMKRVGYPATYAGAVEACASTGGALMPPVMGAVAFIMAEFLNISYATVMIAAVVPALLFYLALLFQADNYAARNGLRGQPAHEIPELWPTLKSGWHFLLALVVLIYLLVWVGIEAHAPYYATVVLLFTSTLQWIYERNRAIAAGMIVFMGLLLAACYAHFGMGYNGVFAYAPHATILVALASVALRPFKLISLVDDSIRNIANIVGVLVGIGMIVGSLSYTGVGGAFSRELLQFAGGNVPLLLIFGAITSFILGMGMTVSACYIFLAIVMGPALIGAGMDPVASHLFILYWGMLSYITPPVALAAVAASTIARSNPISTGFLAMRLGLTNFILPFLFVFTPTLILRGETVAILHDVTTAVIAVWLMSSAFEGWLYFVGRVGYATRFFVLVSAICLLDPGLVRNVGGLFTLPDWGTDAVGVVILALVYAANLLNRSPRAREAT
jgi:TRAP transporter 4TM/12TM fusion protein